MGGALRLLQSCDPPGVGARDVRECLQLQLAQQPNPDPLAARILRDHFELLTQQRFTAIARAVAASLPEVERACAALKRLTPRPGMAFTGDLPPSVVPDLIIVQRDNHYDIELNDTGLPHIGINRAYHRMLKDARTPEEAREFLRKKFRQASWVIKAIDERNATVLAIGRCLLSLQREFIEHGPKALKPLTQAQVAQSIGRHPSTVSRAIAGKTMDTPYGVFRLEEMFASGVPQTAQTDEVSDAAIKSEIARLVTEEDKSRPLSDEVLVQRLRQRNITVARRTIAKYRTTLKVLPGHLRRRRA
jgi:RNA polymerase sigma-54 factor